MLAAIITVNGVIPGNTLWLGLGAALAVAWTRSQQPTVVISVGPIVFHIRTAALSGLLAAIVPARSAARMNMLTAIAAG